MLFDFLLPIFNIYSQISQIISPESLVVNTPYGLVRGYQEQSRDYRSYYSFKGIPYAQIPDGKLRFQPPQSLRPWKGIVDGRQWPSPCVQYDALAKTHLGTEDCLKLNVFSPLILKRTNSNDLIPVIFFVHGGAFLYGSSRLYLPQYVMDENVILVTLHYRLGILGFLNSEDNVIQGNMGAKDVLEALRWIQVAISSFGGDPNRVTVMAQSSGASIVQLLLLSKESKGLINNAILQSATILALWAFIKNTRRQTFRVGTILGCDENDTLELLKCLQSLSPKAFSKFHENEEQFWSEKFGPSVESVHPGALITEPPIDILKSGNYHKIPIVMGVVSNEGCLLGYAVMEKLKKINEDWDFMGNILEINDTTSLEAIRQEYFGNRRKFSKKDLDVFSELNSDWNWKKGLEDFALLYNNRIQEKADLYLYYFDYMGKSDSKSELGLGHVIRRTFDDPNIPFELNIVFEEMKLRTLMSMGVKIPDYGACHSDDLKYFFHQSLTVNARHYTFSKEYVRLWTNFASKGEFENWIPTNKATRSQDLIFHQISDNNLKTPIMISNPFDPQRMKFWDRF